MVRDSWSNSPALHRRWAIVGGSAAAVIFMVLSVRYVDWSDLARAMTSARLLPWIPLAVLAYGAGVLLRGWRLRILVSHETRVSLWTACNVVAIGYATNNVLPGRLGELARSHALTRQTSMGFAEAFTVTVLERVLDGLVMLLLFTLAAGMASADFFESSLVSRIVSGLAIALFASFTLIIAVATLTPHNFTRAVAGSLGRIRRSWHDPAYILCLHVTNGVAYLRRPLGAVRVFLLSVATWLVEALMFLSILVALDLPARFSLSLLAMTVTNLGIAIPSTPGYFGSWHFFCGETLRLSGIDETVAFSYAVLTHLTFYIPITLWGLAVVLAYGLGLRFVPRLASPTAPVNAARLSHLVALPAPDDHKDISHAARFYTALVESLMPMDDLRLADAERKSTNAHVLDFVYRQLSCLPNRVFVLYFIGISAFRLLTLLRYFRPFEALSVDTRRRWIALWADGPVGLTRKLFRPLRSFVLLSYYEYPLVHRALDARVDAGAVVESRT